jgi:hypothetical protein
MKEPVDHILRPQLPWRNEPGITECGLNASKVPTLTRIQFFARLKEMGNKRTSLFTCMTCRDTCERHGTWEDDPRQALEREIRWESPWRTRECGERLKDELTAIASLISEHRETFDGLVAESKRRREWLEKKAEHENRKEHKPVTQLKPRL